MTPFYSVDTVIFDCDSTLSTLEGIDELANRMGVYDQLAPLTQAAMDGELKLDEVYQRRLQLITPTRHDIDWLGKRYVETQVNDAQQTVDALQKSGKNIHIVSGGIRQAVIRLADALNIDRTNVHAVDIYFDDSGAYAGFDETSPLAMSGGKKTVCRKVAGINRRAVIIGDGITDMEAKQERVEVIGFGGVVNRSRVKQSVSDYIEEPSLLPVLKRLLSDTELKRWAPL